MLIAWLHVAREAARRVVARHRGGEGRGDRGRVVVLAMALAGWGRLEAQQTRIEAPVPTVVEAKWDLNDVVPHFDVAGWDADAGLPQNTVHAVLQTKDGHIWVGTSEGLARFDGEHFTVFSRRNTKDFPNSPITALMEAQDGSLWLGTDGSGVARMKDGAFTRYSTSAGLPGTRVSGLAEGPDGSVWIGTTNGLSRWRGGKITNYGEKDGLVRNSVRTLRRGSSGEIWVGTSRGLSVVRGETVSVDETFDGLSSAVFRVLFEDAEGARWVATNAEVAREKEGKITRYTTKQGISPANVEAILQDRAGVLWFAASNGLFRFDREQFVLQPLEGVAPREPVRTISEDREGNLWLGTNDGLKRLRRTMFAAFGVDQGLSHNVVTAVCQDAGGALWVGTDGGGLNRLHGNARMVYLKKHGLPSDGIRGLFPARDGGIWVAFDRSGVVHLRDETMTRYTSDEAFNGGSAQALFEDSRGTLWIGMRGALCTIGDGVVRNVSKALGVDGAMVRVFAEDGAGAMWIGTNRGLVRHHAGGTKVWRESDGLSTDSIRALHFDEQGVLWIGTNDGGLCWIKDGRVYRCGNAEGLPEDTILDVVDDELGHLWLASRRGILRVAKRQLAELAAGSREQVDVASFDKGDGVRGIEGSASAKPGAWRTTDGRLWFATVRSLAMVDPRRLREESAVAPVVLSRVRIQGIDFEPDETPVVAPGNGELEFSYTALSYARPENIEFRYQLEGVNRDWVEAGTRRMATYSGVGPGVHRFRVQARVANGPWSEAPAFSFRLRARFFQTWWFLAACGLAAVGLVYGGVRLRVGALRKREAQLVALVQERTSHLEAEIGERKRTEAALQRSEELYHSLVEVLPLSIYRRDAAGGFVFANQHYCQRLGRALRDVVGRKAEEVYPEEIAAREKAADRQVLETRAAVQWEEMESGADGLPRWFDCLRVPVLDGAGVAIGTQGLSWDITPRKRAEQQVELAHRELLEVSRKAGMAEVATGVLHNVGNVLNSVNVSASLAIDHVRASKAANLTKVAELLREHDADLPGFFTNDARGRAIPNYLAQLAGHLRQEQAAVVTELERLRENIEHIKNIVVMQQSYAKVSGVTETVAVTEVIEDALRLNGSALVRHRVELVRDYRAQPAITTERHRVMQILVNLIENAKYACSEAKVKRAQIVVRVEAHEHAVRVSVTDNGVGIAAENLTRIFAHGFTTRERGHGFGLHSSALAARELGGRMTVNSEGPGCGAEFVLELPFKRGERGAVRLA